MESVRSCRNNSSKSESWHAQKEILTVVSAFFSSPPSLVCLQTAQTPRGEGKENERKTKQREKRNKLMQQITISFPLTSTNNLIRKQENLIPPACPSFNPFVVRVDITNLIHFIKLTRARGMHFHMVYIQTVNKQSVQTLGHGERGITDRWEHHTALSGG